MSGLLEVISASIRPVAVMAALLFGGGLVAGALAADLPTALTAAGWGLVIGVSGLWAHEGTHLCGARWFAGPDAATVTSSMTIVAVRAPDLKPAQALCVALAGPLAGAVVSMAWASVGGPGWIAVAFAGVHLINLLPWGDSDGVQAWRAGCRLLVRRWEVKRGVTGGQ